jgi:hypothetical protein
VAASPVDIPDLAALAASGVSSKPIPPNAADKPKKEILLRVHVETLDVFVRGAAEIAAELALKTGPAVEGLMAYWLSLPEADNLVRDFIRGDLSLFSLGDQTRQMVEHDLDRIKLESPTLLSVVGGTTRLGRMLDADRRKEAGEKIGEDRPSDLAQFVRKNPEIVKQVSASSHEVLVVWVLLYLMHATRARERGNRVASEFVQQHPGLRERIRAVVAKQAPSPKQRSRQGPGVSGQ